MHNLIAHNLTRQNATNGEPMPCQVEPIGNSIAYNSIAHNLIWFCSWVLPMVCRMSIRLYVYMSIFLDCHIITIHCIQSDHARHIRTFKLSDNSSYYRRSIYYSKNSEYGGRCIRKNFFYKSTAAIFSKARLGADFRTFVKYFYKSSFISCFRWFCIKKYHARNRKKSAHFSIFRYRSIEYPPDKTF